MMTRYSDMAPYFRSLVGWFDEHVGADFDVNIGNMPYCVAPDLARKMHHDGEATITVAASGQGTTQVGFDKYLDKRVDKRKLDSCARCVFDDRCGGVFEKYGTFFGYDELVPVSAAQLWDADPAGDLFVMLAGDVVHDWAKGDGRIVGRVDERAGSFDAAIDVDGGRWSFVLQRAGRGRRRDGWAVVSGDRVEAELLGRGPTDDVAIARLYSDLDALDRGLGGNGVDVSSAGDLAASWAAQSRRLAAVQGRRREQRAIAQRAIDTLRRTPLGGLAAVDVARSEDGGWVTLRFAGALGATLELDVGLEPPADGRPRTVLRHRASGVDAPQLARINAAIAAALRAGSRLRA